MEFEKERLMILNMIAEGRITAEEGEQLFQALDASLARDEIPIEELPDVPEEPPIPPVPPMPLSRSHAPGAARFMPRLMLRRSLMFAGDPSCRTSSPHPSRVSPAPAGKRLPGSLPARGRHRPPDVERRSRNAE